MKQLRTILSLTLVLTIVFPASLFAQQTTNIPANLNPQILTYLNQTQAVNVGKAKLLTSLPLLSAQLTSGDLFTGFLTTIVGLIAAGSVLNFVFPVLSLSETMILGDNDYLNKYINARYNRGKERNSVQRFKNLDVLFSKIEKHIDFEWKHLDATLDLVELFYQRFGRSFKLSLEKTEIQDLIRFLKYTENPELVLQQQNFKNLVRSYRLFGEEVTRELMYRSNQNVLDDAHFPAIEKALHETKFADPNMSAFDRVKTAVQEPSLWKVDPEKTDFLEKLKLTKTQNRGYVIARSAIAVVATILICYKFRKWLTSEDNQHASILEQENLSAEEAIAQAEQDPEYFDHLLTDKLFAAICAFIYDQVVQAQRELETLN